MSGERIDWRQLAPQRWKNGAGLTRELAVEPAGASMDDFDWRISVAEVEQDAPFSAFAGVDRCIALLDGAGMTLRSADGAAVRRLDRVGEPFRFAGEMPLVAELVDGPCEDFNVMVRRAAHEAHVTPLRQPGTLEAAPAGMLVCLSGRWKCDGSTLERGQALLWRRGMPRVSVQPQASPALALAVHLYRSPGATRDAAIPGCTRATNT
ncbi:MAG TPA: HutD family protein [Albitalea sp.]|uniref:HutD/Ves family protein n=1 Tax=Piscinibacter sp. TaxID=1903157 RepID=UPI002ED0B505